MVLEPFAIMELASASALILAALAGLVQEQEHNQRAKQ